MLRSRIAWFKGTTDQSISPDIFFPPNANRLRTCTFTDVPQLCAQPYLQQLRCRLPASHRTALQNDCSLFGAAFVTC